MAPISSPEAPDRMAERNSCMGREDSPPALGPGPERTAGRSRRMGWLVALVPAGWSAGPGDAVSWCSRRGGPRGDRRLIWPARPRRSSCPDPSSSQGPAPRSASSRAPWRVRRHRPRRLRHRRRPRAGRRRARAGRLRVHGPGAPGRGRARSPPGRPRSRPASR